MTYADRTAAIAEAYGLLGDVADQISWPAEPWSPVTSVWAAVCGADVGGGGSSAASGTPGVANYRMAAPSAPDVSVARDRARRHDGDPPCISAVAPEAAGNPPAFARGAVEPGLAGGGR